MPIVYAVIARGTTVLAEHTLKNTHGNFLAITRQLLKVIKSNDTKATVICQSCVMIVFVIAVLVLVFRPPTVAKHPKPRRCSQLSPRVVECPTSDMPFTTL